MKLVPTSLEESQNFERGLDPKTSMDIGANRELKVGDAVELFSFRTGKPFDKGIILRFQKHNEVEVTSSNGSLIIASGLLRRFNPTNESLNFERGEDPKKSMSIGIAQKMKKMLSHIHMEPRMATHDYFSFLGGVPSNVNIIYGVKSVLWKIYFDKKSPAEAFELACKEWMISEFDANLIKEVLKRELNLNINESLDFQRGTDPKTVMKIGQMELVYIDFMKGDYDDYEIISSDEGKYFISLKTAEKIFQKCQKYKEGINDFDEEIEVRIFEGFPLISLINDYGILSIWTKNEDSEKIILLMRNKKGKSVEESLNFERGIDPKTSMSIGDAAILPPLIDSNILFAITTIEMRDDEDDYDRTEDEMKEDEENYRLVKRAEKFLKGKATFGKYFDWKEEDDMIEYIQKYARGRYVYNATPGQDGWQVVFSKVYLPRAEEIDI